MKSCNMVISNISCYTIDMKIIVFLYIHTHAWVHNGLSHSLNWLHSTKELTDIANKDYQ